MNYGKCQNCVHRQKNECRIRGIINPKYINAWGCDYYKANYESLLKKEDK